VPNFGLNVANIPTLTRRPNRPIQPKFPSTGRTPASESLISLSQGIDALGPIVVDELI
jgi:hypothetical protein